MADDMLFSNIGQRSGPAAQWRNYAQGDIATVTLGSGAVEGTALAGKGILKGVFLMEPNTPIFVFLDAAATMHVCASGAIAANWVPCWEEFKTSLIIQKKSGSAEIIYPLIGTGLAPFV